MGMYMNRLTKIERCKIEALYNSGMRASKIANELGIPFKSQGNLKN